MDPPSEEAHETGEVAGDKRKTDPPAEEASTSKRFRIIASKDQCKWSLPEDLASYCNEHLNSFFSKEDLEENILIENPIPDNVQGVQSLDEIVSMLLSSNEKHLDASLLKIQQNVTNIFGPLCRVWSQIEQVDKSEEADLSLPVIKELVEKTVLLTAQSINSVMYQRRLFALNAIEKDSKKAASQLKQKADVLKQSSPLLFGKDFHEYLTEAAKMGKKIKELQNALRPQSSSQWSSRTPFRKNPSSSRRNDGGQRLLFRREDNNKKPYGKNSKKSYLQHREQFPNRRGIESSTSCDKRIVFRKTKSLCLSREFKIFPEELGKDNPRSSDLKKCSRISNPITSTSTAKQTFIPGSSESSTEVDGRGGNSIYAGEGSNKKSSISERGISKFNFSGSKERWGQSTSYKFKKFKQLHTISTLQDGGVACVKGSDSGRGFHVQNRSERRSRTSSSSVYKVDESTCRIATQVEYKTDHISGRYSYNRNNAKRSVTTQRDSCVSSSKPGVCYKHQEVSCSPNPTNRIFGDDDKLKRNDSFSPSRKGGEDNTTVSSFKNSQRSDCLRPNQTNWSSVVISSCSFTSKAAISLSSEPTNTLLEKKSLFPMQSSFKPSLSSRIRMVDNKSDKLQWAKSKNYSSGDGYLLRCLNEGMGCGLQGKDDRREVVKGGPVTSYQHSGVEGSFLCDFSIHQRGETKISAYPDRQQGSLDLPLKNGRNCKYENESNQQGNLRIFTSSRDHDYCRVSSNSFECGGRLGFSKTRGQKRMETLSKDISTTVPKEGFSTDRSFCISTVN